MNELTFTEKLITRERIVTLVALMLITMIAWWYLLTGAGTGMNISAMTTWQFPQQESLQPFHHQWTLHYALLMLLMWWVMMIAMMLPSATPMILLYARVYRQAQTKRQINSIIIPTPAFVAGYLFIWFGFSVAAVLLQHYLEQLGIVHGVMMWITERQLSAGLLIIAGIYQFSPIKHACLKQCRSPVEFISRYWQQGNLGAMNMGMHHGIFCLGCCWILMLLLFSGGIMNLVWIAGLAIIVLAEKCLPFGQRFSQLSGILLCVSGSWIMIH
jgi:predicted metal-binding membrane protein